MKTITLRVEDQVHRGIKTTAAQTDTSIQELILDVLRTSEKTAEILKRTEPKGS